MAKYRLIQSTNNMCVPAYSTFVIEKYRKFLFWEWWSQDYLFGVEGCYHFAETEEEKAKNALAILNGEKEWTTNRIIVA